MNDNTILRIKVPAHLYESVKEQLTINEAAKAKKQYGAEFSVVKEKKAPKKEMEKVEEINNIEEKDNKIEMKTRTLDELKAAKDKLEKKIAGMKEAKDVPYHEIAAKAINMALENGNTDQSKLDILTTLKDAIQKKIKSMHSPAMSESKMEQAKKEEGILKEAVDPNLIAGIIGLLFGSLPILYTIIKQYVAAKTPEDKKNVIAQAANTISKKMSGGMEEAKKK